MNYTQRPEEWVDEVIGNHMEIICDEVLSSISGVKAIVLTGGFAKGEGGVRVFPKGREVFPVNDYDIYVITDRSIPLKTLIKASERAVQRIGAPVFSLFSGATHSFYVDLRCLQTSKLRYLPPVIRYFELKHVGKVLYGEKVLTMIPNYTVQDIPSMDGIRLLFNRMGNLITYFSPKCIREGVFDNRDFLVYSCHKCIIACGAALLLLSEKLRYSDMENMKVLTEIYENDFPDLYRILPDLPERVQSSTNFLLIPDFTKVKDPVQLWFMTREYLDKTLRYYVARVLHEEPSWGGDWTEFSYKVYRKLGRIYLKPFVRQIVGNNLHVPPMEALVVVASLLAKFYINFLQFHEIHRKTGQIRLKTLFNAQTPDLTLYSAIPLILYSIDERGNITRKMLDHAAEYIEMIYPLESLDANADLDEYWDALKDKFTLGLRLFLSSVITKT